MAETDDRSVDTPQPAVQSNPDSAEQNAAAPPQPPDTDASPERPAFAEGTTDDELCAALVSAVDMDQVLLHLTTSTNLFDVPALDAFDPGSAGGLDDA
jgi:hypothetical protein